MTDSPITPRRSLFAIWHWPRWARWTIYALVISGPPLYFLSAIPVTRVLRQKYQAHRIATIAHTAYRPVWLCRRWAPASAALQWEDRIMNKILGPESGMISY